MCLYAFYNPTISLRYDVGLPFLGWIFIYFITEFVSEKSVGMDFEQEFDKRLPLRCLVAFF